MKFVILISVLIKVCLSKTSVVKSTTVAVTTEAVTTAEVTIGSTDASVTSGKPMIEECPYIASIELNNQHNCGGVIIVKNKILTSAHCCNFNTTELKVRVGSEIKGQDGTVLEVEKIRSHEKFNKTSLDYDVCVLTLKADIPIDDKNMKIAKLNDKAIDGGEKVVEYGYGHLNSTHTSNYLLKYETTTISNKDCMEQMIHPSTKETLITENMMCINLVDGKGQKNKDDGGPVMKLDSDLVIGIISWQRMKEPGDGDTAGVSANVHTLADWIKKEMADK